MTPPACIRVTTISAVSKGSRCSQRTPQNHQIPLFREEPCFLFPVSCFIETNPQKAGTRVRLVSGRGKLQDRFSNDSLTHFANCGRSHASRPFGTSWSLFSTPLMLSGHFFCDVIHVSRPRDNKKQGGFGKPTPDVAEVSDSAREKGCHKKVPHLQSAHRCKILMSLVYPASQSGSLTPLQNVRLRLSGGAVTKS